MRKDKRTIIALATGGALLALAIPKIAPLIGSGPGSGNPSAGGSSEKGIAVQFTVVRPEQLGSRVTTVGTVLSNESIEVRSQVSGQIEQISFREGSRVGKGGLLVKINDDELQAQLGRARSRLAIAEQQAGRQRQLFEKSFVSQEEYNNVLNELNVAKAELDLVLAQIEKTEIRARFDGTIGLRFVSEGSYISPATVITTLQDNSRMKIDFTVPEKYAGELRVGDRITFRVQTRTEQFEGKIYSIDARIDASTRTLRVRALAPNPKGVLIPGSFADVDLVLSERKAITIPSYALIPELKGHKVFVWKGGKAEPQIVEIGNRAEDRVEITRGLQPGDTLITSGILQLRPGMAVRPLKHDGEMAR
jgi:membrane fusion protein (multidrug efflux system)